MDRVRQQIASRADVANPNDPLPALKDRRKAPAQPEPTPTPAKPAEKAIQEVAPPEVPDREIEAPEPAEKPLTAPDKVVPAPDKTAPPAAPPEKKPGPWQLKDKYEKLAKQYEREVVELKEKLARTGDSALTAEQNQKLDARVKELEEEIRYVNYQKHPEYVEKWEKPLQQAWATANRDLAEISITGTNGETRPATLEDMVTLVNMPIGQARATAEELFGPLANDVMVHRKSIRDLALAQQEALANAKKVATEREQQQTALRSQIREQTGKLWQQFEQEDAAKDPFLQPVEGDEEWNGALNKSLDYVKKALATNTADPSLTSEQRGKAIRDQANITARAKVHPMLVLQIQRQMKEIEELKAKIGKYQQGEPSKGDGHTAAGEGASAVGGDPMERARNRIRNLPRVQGVYGQ